MFVNRRRSVIDWITHLRGLGPPSLCCMFGLIPFVVFSGSLSCLDFGPPHATTHDIHTSRNPSNDPLVISSKQTHTSKSNSQHQAKHFGAQSEPPKITPTRHKPSNCLEHPPAWTQGNHRYSIEDPSAPIAETPKQKTEPLGHIDNP